MSRFVVIEGLIGVGKTSLCRILNRRWGAKLVLEPWDDNPFLNAFYSDRDRYAFPAQMFYLATRTAQQMDLLQGDLFAELVISDYLMQKDRLFAELTLEGDELALYDQFAGLLGTHIPKPEFVLFLDSPTDVIQGRIQRRAIESEQVIEDDYLDALRDRYYALWDRYTDAPVYVLDTSTMHYVDDPAAEEHVLAMIQGWLDGKPVPDAPRAYGTKDTKQLGLFA